MMKITNHEEYVLACEDLRVMVDAIEQYRAFNEVDAEKIRVTPNYKSIDLTRNANRIQPHHCETYPKGSFGKQMHSLGDSVPRGYKFFSKKSD